MSILQESELPHNEHRPVPGETPGNGKLRTPKEYKAALKARRRPSKATLADIECVLVWWETGARFDVVEATRLYNRHSAEYCELLCLLNEDLPHKTNYAVCAEVVAGRVVYYLERSDFFGRLIDREKITEAQTLRFERSNGA